MCWSIASNLPSQASKSTSSRYLKRRWSQCPSGNILL